MNFRWVVLPLLLTGLLLGTGIAAGAGWNDSVIEWKSYSEGMRLAAEEDRPVMLVFHSEGCGACADYSKLFYDPAVVEASRGLLMIIMDDGEDEDISVRFSEDGSYVPRTYFLSAKAELLPIRIGKPDTRFQYYLGPQGADVLAGFMLKAIAMKL